MCDLVREFGADSAATDCARVCRPARPTPCGDRSSACLEVEALNSQRAIIKVPGATERTQSADET
jgi:hypothetical protein